MEKFEQPSENLNKEEKIVSRGGDGNYIESYINPKTKETLRLFVKDEKGEILQFIDLTGKEKYVDEIKKIFDKYGVNISNEKLIKLAEDQKTAKLNEMLDLIDKNESIEN